MSQIWNFLSCLSNFLSRISYQNFYRNMQSRIHGVGDLRSSQCGPPITTHSSVSILIPTLYGVSKPTAAGSFSGKFSQRITVFAFRISLENSYLGPSFCAPPARSTSDHNGFGSSWYSTTLVSGFRAQAYQPSWDLLSGFCRVAKSPLILNNFISQV